MQPKTCLKFIKRIRRKVQKMSLLLWPKGFSIQTTLLTLKKLNRTSCGIWLMTKS